MAGRAGVGDRRTPQRPVRPRDRAVDRRQGAVARRQRAGQVGGLGARPCRRRLHRTLADAASASEVAEAFERLATVRAVDVGEPSVDVPAGRLRALARYGLAAKAQTLRRLSPDRRIATLLAALWQLELDATDDALIVLDRVCGLLLSHAAREHKDRRYGELPDLDRAARRLRAAVLVLLDPPAGGIEELWSAIDRHVSRSELERAAATVHELASEPDDSDGQEAAFRG